MANNIRDAKSAALGGMMDIQLAMQQFQQEWNAPDFRRAKAYVEKQILNKWDARRPELAAIQAENPEAYQKANARIEEIRKRVGGKPAEGG
jgi:hypothetical protein